MSIDDFQRRLDAARQETDAEADYQGQIFGQDLASTVRRLMDGAHYLVNIVPGWIRAVWHETDGSLSGYCSMVVPEGYGRNEDVVLDNVAFGLGKLPEAGERYMVYFGSGGHRWIKLMIQAGRWLYYSEPGNLRVFRIPWPPATPDQDAAEPELVVEAGHIEFLGVGHDERIYLWTMGHLETWLPAVEGEHTGVRETRIPLDSIPTQGIGGATGAVQIQPLSVERTPGSDDVPVLVGQARTAVVSGNVQTATLRLYRSADRGDSWEQVREEPAQVVIGAPSLSTTINYTGRIGWEPSAVLRIGQGESGVLGSADDVVLLMSTPFYGNQTYALADPRNSDQSFPRALALVRSNGNPLTVDPPREFDSEVAAFGPVGSEGAIRALAFSVHDYELAAVDDNEPVTKLYRTNNLGAAAWQEVVLPGGTDAWYPFKRNLIAQDRAAASLVLIEDSLTRGRVATWWSDNGGETWLEMNTEETGGFVRGVIIDA